MRKFLIPLLMVSAALPTVANAQWRNVGREDGDRAARSQQDNRGERPQRVERPQPAERPQQIERQQVERPRFERPQVEARRPDNQNVARPSRNFVDAMRNMGQQQQAEQAARQQQVDAMRQRQADMARQQQNRQRETQGRRVGERDPQDVQRNGWNGYRDRVINQGQVTPQDRGRDWNDRRDRDGDGRRWQGNNNNPQRWANRDGSWSNRWRGDNRYDWQRYRNQNRSIFRIGIYSDPYGYNYRRYNVGYNMWPSYYQSNYWIDDPWMYRLPQVWGPYRWVRYYNDALLVNIYSGQVEDVLYNFFW